MNENEENTDENIEETNQSERHAQESGKTQNKSEKRKKANRHQHTDTKGGVVYILTNRSFPGYVKIGFASDMEKRLKELNSSECMPFAFKVYATFKVDHDVADKDLHAIIDTINPELRAIDSCNGKPRKKEFYAMTPEDAYTVLDKIQKFMGKDGLLDKAASADEDNADEGSADIVQAVQATIRRQRAENFTFARYGIEPGEEIHFISDPTITATVISDRQVRYDGRDWYLSPLTSDLMGVSYQLQGTLYWKYGDTVLSDLRENDDSDEDDSDEDDSDEDDSDGTDDSDE